MDHATLASSAKRVQVTDGDPFHAQLEGLTALRRTRIRIGMTMPREATEAGDRPADALQDRESVGGTLPRDVLEQLLELSRGGVVDDDAYRLPQRREKRSRKRAATTSQSL